MTTLLTLVSMFGSLSTVTHLISCTTKPDVWMVACIVFVFLTLAEFTGVIFLKYYWTRALLAKATATNNNEGARKAAASGMGGKKGRGDDDNRHGIQASGGNTLDENLDTELLELFV